MTARDRWASSGLLAFRLPSGFIVSGVWPSIGELTRRGVVPWALRKAVMEKYGTPGEELSDEEVQRNLELRLRLAASFVSGLYDDETGEWETVHLTFEELVDGTMPGDDIEALDAFVWQASETSPERAALIANLTSELILGLVEAPSAEPEPKPKEEAGDTVDGFAEFRDERRGEDGDAERGDVAPTPIRAPRNRKPNARVPSGRRPRAAAAAREAAG